jgi:hypothetical protein
MGKKRKRKHRIGDRTNLRFDAVDFERALFTGPSLPLDGGRG